MKKLIRNVGLAAMSLCLFYSTATTTSFANETEDPFTRLEQQGYRIITSNSVYSVKNFDAENIESNLLFDQQAFASVLDNQPYELSEAIYEGNIVAVYDDSNELHAYEKTMNLRLGFDTISGRKSGTHKSIGYIYQSDESGGIHITRVNVYKDIDSEEEKLYAFAEILLNYEAKSSAPMVFSQARSEMDTEFLGTITDYYEEDDEKGDVSVMYEVSTAQDIGKYDYYVIHAYIDATPGRALHYNKYDADVLTVRLSTSTSGATLYKTGPNTVTGTNSYTVDIGIEGSINEGIGGLLDFSWSGTISDVDIKKKVKSSKECEWIVDINDWKEVAESTISFEPGGTFRVAKDKEELCVSGFIVFEVDSWNEVPSIAVLESTRFYCSPDVVDEDGE